MKLHLDATMESLYVLPHVQVFSHLHAIGDFFLNDLVVQDGRFRGKRQQQWSYRKKDKLQQWPLQNRRWCFQGYTRHEHELDETEVIASEISPSQEQTVLVSSPHDALGRRGRGEARWLPELLGIRVVKRSILYTDYFSNILLDLIAWLGWAWILC